MLSPAQYTEVLLHFYKDAIDFFLISHNKQSLRYTLDSFFFIVKKWIEVDYLFAHKIIIYTVAQAVYSACIY